MRFTMAGEEFHRFKQSENAMTVAGFGAAIA